LDLLFDAYAPVTRELLGEERVNWLRRLPAEHREAEGNLLLLHASPGDLWRAPLPTATDDELTEAYGNTNAGLVVYGHVHQPYVRELATLTVANSGSVGMPFDGDPRASYLLIDAGTPEVVRVEYDVDREVALLRGSGYPDAERLAQIRQRGAFVAPR